MNFLKDFCLIVADITLFEYYPFITLGAITLLVWGFNIFLMIIKPIKLLYKTLVVSLLLFCSSLVILKVFCDFIIGSTPNIYSIGVGFATMPFTLVGCMLIFVIKGNKNLLNNVEKQLIDRLLNEDKPNESLLSRGYFSENPYKRIERLNTQKGFFDQTFSDFNINPSYVEKRVDELLKKDLNLEDKLTAEEIFNAVQKYKLKNLSNFERDDFSTNLQKLIKLTAKYDKANFDLF